MLARLRRLSSPLASLAALFFALAQHAAQLHDFGHAAEAVRHHSADEVHRHAMGLVAAGAADGDLADHAHDQHPCAPPLEKCDTHYASAQFAGGAAVSPPAIPGIERATAARFFPFASEVRQAPRLAFHSRAPPA